MQKLTLLFILLITIGFATPTIIQDNTVKEINPFTTTEHFFTIPINIANQADSMIVEYNNEYGAITQVTGFTKQELKKYKKDSPPAGVTFPIEIKGYGYGKFNISIYNGLEEIYIIDPWFNSTFQYRQHINITETSGANLTDYQLRLNITYDSDMNSSFKDLRFTDSDEETEISYWIENYTISNKAMVWVPLSINASDTRIIYMYYGNPAVETTGNATDVFGSGLINFYSFNSANTADVIGTDEGIGANLVLTPDKDGNIDSAYTFNGVSSYVSTGTTVTSAFTWNIWVQRGAIDAWQHILSSNSGGADGGMKISIWNVADADEGKAFFAIYTPSENGFKSAVVDNNVWHMITLTRNGSKTKIYIDGVYYIDSDLTPTAPATDNVAIGSASVLTNAFFAGNLDDVRIYDEELDVNEIAEFYVSSEPTYVFGSEEEDTDTTDPIVAFINQTPNDYTRANIINVTTVWFNATDEIALNLSTALVYVNLTNSNGFAKYYVNGTVYNINDSLVMSNATTNTTFNEFWLTEHIDKYLPITYNIDQSIMEATTHSTVLIDSTTEGIKIELHNVSASTRAGTFMFMANKENAGSTILNVYYCNNSYSTGKVLTSPYCTLFGVEDSDSYDHSGHGNSSYMITPFNLNASGYVNSVKVTSTSYFVLKATSSNGWNVHYISNDSRVNDGMTTGNGGTSWSDVSGTIDAHLVQVSDNETFYYYACVNDTSDNEGCSAVQSDLIDLVATPPSSPQIYTPNESSYTIGDVIFINYSASTPYYTNSIVSYNITLYNSSQDFIEQIYFNDLNLTYSWNTTGKSAGDYFIRVIVNDNESLTNFGQSKLFTLIVPYIPSTFEDVTTTGYVKKMKYAPDVNIDKKISDLTIADIADVRFIFLLIIGIVIFVFALNKAQGFKL